MNLKEYFNNSDDRSDCLLCYALRHNINNLISRRIRHVRTISSRLILERCLYNFVLLSESIDVALGGGGAIEAMALPNFQVCIPNLSFLLKYIEI